MFLSVGIDHIVGTGLDIGQRAVLHTADVAVAHQRDAVAVDTDDAVHHIAAAFDPCQHNIADGWRAGTDEDDTLTTANDERKHAVSLDGEGNAQSVIDQGYGTL